MNLFPWHVTGYPSGWRAVYLHCKVAFLNGLLLALYSAIIFGAWRLATR